MFLFHLVWKSVCHIRGTKYREGIREQSAEGGTDSKRENNAWWKALWCVLFTDYCYYGDKIKKDEMNRPHGSCERRRAYSENMV
jgi:hypothetical protein